MQIRRWSGTLQKEDRRMGLNLGIKILLNAHWQCRNFTMNVCIVCNGRVNNFFKKYFILNVICRAYELFVLCMKKTRNSEANMCSIHNFISQAMLLHELLPSCLCLKILDLPAIYRRLWVRLEGMGWVGWGDGEGGVGSKWIFAFALCKLQMYLLYNIYHILHLH